MENYTREGIYCLVGREDKTAGLTFRPGSDAFIKYGKFIVVQFLYTQYERVEMDKMVLNKPFSHHGHIKAKSLDSNLSEDKVNLLLTEGINSEDIIEILSTNYPSRNTYHSTETRQIDKIEIPMSSLPKGQDLNWMYGFKKRLIKDGIGLCPKEMAFYLGCKLYMEPENLTAEETRLIHDDQSDLKEEIEFEYLSAKHIQEKIEDFENQRLAELWDKKQKASLDKLDAYLNDVGSSLTKLFQDDREKAVDLMAKTVFFQERRVNVTGKYPVYIDQDSYLHIFMRHVEEFKFNNYFELKDNFQWVEDDILNVMGHVIKAIDEEYQQFRETHPGIKFSKYGRQSYYFEGDYYTLHIEPTGRISTFYKNKKEHEKPAVGNN